MSKFIENKLNEKNNNVYKDLLALIPEEPEDAKEFLNNMYEEFMDMIKQEKQKFNEADLIEYLKEGIAFLNEINDDFEEQLNKMRNSKAMKFKVSLMGKKNMYREIEFPMYLAVADMAYAVLGAFNAYEGYDYEIEYKKIKFACDELMEEEPNKYVSAVNTRLDDLNINKGDTLRLDYDYADWIFDIEVLDVYGGETREHLIEPKLLNSKGYDILDGERYMFDLLMNENFEEVRKYCEGDSHYNTLIEYYKDKNPSLSNEEFLDRLCMEYRIYENDEKEKDELGLEEKKIFEERAKREKELQKLPHIIEYQRSKKIYASVLEVLYDHLEKNRDIYENNFRSLLHEKHEVLPEAISINNIKLEGNAYTNLSSCFIYPFSNEYVSVVERYRDYNDFNDEQIEMLETLYNSHLSYFKIKSNDAKRAYVVIKDLINKKEYKIVDMNLSYGLSVYPNWPCFLGRVFECNGISFVDNAIFVLDSEEFRKNVKLAKDNKHTSFDMYVNTFLLNKKQNL